MEKRRRPPAQDIGRILGGNMSPEDFIKLMKATEIDFATYERVGLDSAMDFVEACEGLGDAAYTYAIKQEEIGHKVTASEYFFNASALYRLGDYGIRGLTEEKFRIYGKLVDSFERSKRLCIREKCEAVEIPFEGKSMPGYLLIPPNAPHDVPVVIQIVGATGFKEENYKIAYTTWERGMATLIFDGPGQGVSLLNRGIYLDEKNYNRAVEAVIGFIRKDKRLGTKIGIMGVSYGGYLATSAAAYCPSDINALICRGGCSQTDQLTMHSFAGIERFYLYGFMEKFNVKTLDEAAEISHKMTVEPMLERITCPVLVQHTEEDPVIGIEGPHCIFNNVSSKDKEYYEIPGNVHCGNNEAQKVCDYGVDWMADRLLK